MAVLSMASGAQRSFCVRGWQIFTCVAMLESCFCDSVSLLDKGAWKPGCAPFPGAPFPTTRLPLHLGWNLGMDSNPSLIGERGGDAPQFFCDSALK